MAGKNGRLGVKALKSGKHTFSIPAERYLLYKKLAGQDPMLRGDVSRFAVIAMDREAQRRVRNARRKSA